MVFGILLTVVGAFITGGACGVLWSRRPAGEGSTANHRNMARWIDATINDDLVRPLIPEARIDSARKYLVEFYGKET